MRGLEQAMRDAARKPAGKPLSESALSGLVLGAGGIAALAVSGIGYRLGWWLVGTALNVAEWAVYAAALGLVVSVIGAMVSRPGAGRRGFLLESSRYHRIAASRSDRGTVGISARSLPADQRHQHRYRRRAVFWDMPNPTEYPGAKTAALQRAAYPDLAPLDFKYPARPRLCARRGSHQGEGMGDCRRRTERRPHRSRRPQLPLRIPGRNRHPHCGVRRRRARRRALPFAHRAY